MTIIYHLYFKFLITTTVHLMFFHLMDLIDFCRVKRKRRSVICPLKVCSFTALCVEL